MTVYNQYLYGFLEEYINKAEKMAQRVNRWRCIVELQLSTMSKYCSDNCYSIRQLLTIPSDRSSVDNQKLFVAYSEPPMIFDLLLIIYAFMMCGFV